MITEGAQRSASQPLRRSENRHGDFSLSRGITKLAVMRGMGPPSSLFRSANRGRGDSNVVGDGNMEAIESDMSQRKQRWGFEK